MVAVVTFRLEQKLPYKKMLVLTGILLGGVLIVMVGESVQELQLAGWLPTHEMHMSIPGWMGIWFAVFPNWESMLAQLLAAAFVIGSFGLVRTVKLGSANRTSGDAEEALIATLDDAVTGEGRASAFDSPPRSTGNPRYETP